MPPPPSAYYHESDIPELSDNDIELLHQIVLRAQQRHEVQKQPKRTLFEAYEAVFLENGRDTRQDRACLRIILQLGEPQIPGELLYDRFEFVLRQLGVTLAFGDDESTSPNDEKAATRLHRAEEIFAQGAPLLAPPEPTRRASFTSMHDFTHAELPPSRIRPLSRASESQLLDEREKLPVSQQRISPHAARSDTKGARRRYFSDQHPVAHRNWIRNVHNDGWHPAIKRASRRARSFGGSETEQELSPKSGYAEGSFYPPLQNDLDGDAEAFNDMRYRNLQRGLLSRWVRRISERRKHIQALELQAESRDFLILKRQALDFWRSAHHRKRLQHQEERFFEHLHNRAGHAYDLYLLTKSFTHWIQITSGAVAKTNAVQERFLFTKYFNAWYDFTVSTELKAERQGLKQPFYLLRRRARQYHQDQVNAVEICQQNVKKNVFWHWFREWCDRAAPRFKEQQLQRLTFKHWLRTTRTIQFREVDVSAEHVRRSIQSIFRLWATKARIDVAGYHQADAFRRSRLLSPILLRWNAEARLRPFEGQILRLQDWKTARMNFSIWRLRTRMFLHADSVSTKRVLQNAFTAWNEQLRSQALVARVNDRIMAQATYRWVIAQRFALLSRICDRRRKGRVLKSFFSGIRRHWNQLASREEQFVVARRQMLLMSAFGSWNRRKVASDTRSQIALNFYSPKLKQDTLEAIRLKLRQQEKLERWVYDARFYFLTTRHIAHWRAVATNQKRSRERAAYAKLRRQYKLNLARNLLLMWRHKSRVRGYDSENSGQIYVQKIKVFQERLFRHWQAASAESRGKAVQASMQYDERVLERSLESLMDFSRQLNGMQFRAEQYRHLKMSEICSTQLRRFSLRAFEIRRRDKDADAMHDRHWSKHVRNMIRHWASKTRDSVHQDLVSNMATEKPDQVEPTDAGYGTASNEDHAQSSQGIDLSATRRAEEWTAFDHDLLEGSEWIPPLDDGPLATSTPVAPGYLNTPSKRAARAKAVANLSTTPATPSHTPFAARLKAGIGNSPTSQIQRKTAGIKTARRGGPSGFRSALGSEVKHSKESD